MNFFAYRLPNGGDVIVTGKSERITKSADCKGFAISTFDIDDSPVYTIPCDEQFDIDNIDSLITNNEQYTMPTVGSTREEHKEEVKSIQNAIARGEISKAIAARCIVTSRNGMRLSESFKILCETYPEAFVFCYHTDLHGTWLGASPELLLRHHNGCTESVALAGTRLAGCHDEWDNKNIEEHNIVTLYIIQKYIETGISVEVQAAYTKQAGPVEHRCQLIRGKAKDPMALALKLSPTPALSGYPQREAIRLIESIETFSRGCYGGFCGPIDSDKDLDLYVNLRSMQLDNERIALYVGGGITKDSDANEEWDETCKKSTTLINPLKINI
jgi:isochorismate synthase